MAIIISLASFLASGIVTSLRECLKRLRMQGDIKSQQLLIILSVIESDLGDLLGDKSVLALRSLVGVTRFLIMSC